MQVNDTALEAIKLTDQSTKGAVLEDPYITWYLHDQLKI